jgi:hypothetical protein
VGDGKIFIFVKTFVRLKVKCSKTAAGSSTDRYLQGLKA